MKNRSIAHLIAGVLFVIVLAGCAGTQKQESTGEYVDDAVITTKVKSVILHEKFANGIAVNVETFKGVVQLSGFVKSQADHEGRQQAIKALYSGPGGGDNAVMGLRHGIRSVFRPFPSPLGGHQDLVVSFPD